jgi:hypothetical protein
MIIKQKSSFHENVMIFDFRFEIQPHPWLRERELKNFAPIFLKKIFEIKGVKFIKSEKNELFVEKSSVFDWDTDRIASQVFEILEKEEKRKSIVEETMSLDRLRVMP